MAGKKKEPYLTVGDVLVAFLVALVGGVAAFAIIAFAGYQLSGRQAMITETSDVSQTVQDDTPPVAQVSVPNFSERQRAESQSVNQQTVLPNEPEPEPAEAPVQQNSTPEETPSQATAPSQTQTTPQTQTQTKTQTNAKTPTTSSGQTQTNAPTQQTQATGQSGNSDSNSTSYSRENWPEGKYLGSNQSDKYHWHNCRAASNILSENEVWFSSENEAKAAGYSRCGICW